MTSVQEILSHDQSKDQDFYQLLGCDEDSSVEQINTEYKVRALQYHPDKNNGDKESEAKFQQLKYAKEVLCDPERRANYDKWRKSGIAMSYQQWLGLKEHVHQSMHWSTPKTKDRMLGDGSSAGSAAAGSKQQKPVNRRASEGGANIHWSGRQQTNIPWDNQPPSEVVSKFRNYEI